MRLMAFQVDVKDRYRVYLQFYKKKVIHNNLRTEDLNNRYFYDLGNFIQ